MLGTALLELTAIGLAAKTVIFTLHGWDFRITCLLESSSYFSHSLVMIFPELLSFIIDLRYGASLELTVSGGAMVLSVPLQASAARMILSGNIV